MAYIFQGDLYCDKCGKSIRKDIRAYQPESVPCDVYDKSSYDSDDYPVYVLGDDEADCPQHCGSGPKCLDAETMPSGRKVGHFFMNGLTSDGEEYVLNAHFDNPANEVALMWLEHYASQGYSKIQEVVRLRDAMLEFLLD